MQMLNLIWDDTLCQTLREEGGSTKYDKGKWKIKI